MSFEYVIWVSPWGYEKLYSIMNETGATTVKQALKKLLLEGVQDEGVVARALALAERREAVRYGPRAAG